MSSDDDKDDLDARTARNDAIRQARDRRKAGLPATETESEGASDAGTGPNYVEFIDRKMREKDKPKD
jgi:hypothetical protein